MKIKFLIAMLFFFSVVSANYEYARLISCNRRPKDTLKVRELISRAKVFADSAEYDSAAFYYKEAGEIYHKAKIWDQYVTCRIHVFTQLRFKESKEDLMPYVRENLKIAQRKLRKNHSLTANCYNNIGNIYTDRNVFDSAIYNFKRAVEIWIQNHGEYHKDVAMAYSNLAVVYTDIEDFKTAQEYILKSIDIKKKVHGEHHESLAQSYSSLGALHYYQGEYKECANYFEKTLEIELANHPADHPLISNCYNNLGVVHAEMDDYEKALEYYFKSLDIRLRKLDPLHPNIALSYNNIANAYMAYGRFAEAEEYHKKALAIRLEIFDTTHLYVGMSYTNLGVLNYELGYHLNALDYFKKALSIYIAIYGEDHLQVADEYENVGSAYHGLGEYENALKFLEIALAIRINQNKRGLKVARSYTNIGNICQLKGNYDLAQSYFEKSLSISHETIGENNLSVAGLYRSFGSLYMEKDEPYKALEYFKKSLELHEELVGEINHDVANIYLKMGSVYGNIKKYEEEAECYQKGLVAITGSAGEIHPTTARLYIGSGLNLHKRGKSQEGIKLINKSLDIFKTIHGENHISLVDAYDALGEIYYSMEKYDSALVVLKRSLMLNYKGNPEEIGKSITIRWIPDELAFFNTLVSMGDVLYDKYYSESNDIEDLLETVEIFNNALQLSSRIRKLYYLEDTKLDYLKRTSDIYSKAIHASFDSYIKTRKEKYRDMCYCFMEQCRNTVLLDATHKTNIETISNIPDSLLSAESDLERKISDLKTKLLLFHVTSEQKDSLYFAYLNEQYNTARINYENLMESLNTNYPAFTELMYKDLTVPIDSLMNLIADNTAIVQYHLSDSSLFIGVVKQTQYKIIRVDLPPDFKNDIENYISCIKKNRRQEYIDLNDGLYSVLLSPIGLLISDNEKLIIIPDKELLYLPFETLAKYEHPHKQEEQERYLIMDYEISYHYSSSLWANTHSNRYNSSYTGKGNALSFKGFAPVFSNDDSRRFALLDNNHYRSLIETDSILQSITRDGLYLNELPYSEQEINDIVQLFKHEQNPAYAYIKEDATEENFRNEVGKSTFVHLATHGLLDDEYPELSALAFYKNEYISDNANLKDDGILFTSEIYNLKMHADLVVLSACETGIGKYAEGEGIMSLTRGFVYAGVSNIIFSFWKIGDKHTAEFMRLFYTSVLEGKSFASALRETKLQFIRAEETSYPGIWGGFSLIGQ